MVFYSFVSALAAVYTEAIELVPKGHPAVLPLLGNRAACNLSANTFKQCLEDCDAVLAIVPDDVKSLLRRVRPGPARPREQVSPHAGLKEEDGRACGGARVQAKAYEALEKLDNALADYRRVLELDASQTAATQGVTRVNNSTRWVSVVDPVPCAAS